MTLRGEVDSYLAHIERGEPERAVDGVLALFDAGLSCRQIVAEVLAPAQLEVGRRWETDEWSVADEHLATAVVDDVLGALAARVDRAHGAARTMALCSAEGEWHVTPLRMGALVLREQGWRVRLLGASTPADHLHATLRHLGADVVVVHCALPANLGGVPPVVAAAHDLGLPVLAAGRAFGSDDARALRLGCDGWAPDAASGAALADAWMDGAPSRDEPAPSPHADELVAIRAQQEALVDAAMRVLEQRLPLLADYDEQQREHTRADLHHILDAAAVTLLVDDRRIFAEFLAWLQMVLVARGVPVAAITAGLDALVEAAGPRLAGLRDVLEQRDGLG